MASAARADVLIFAAASLRGALDDFAEEWSAQTGERAVLSYAGSGVLAAQIIHGAPANIFISAAPEWTDKLVRDGAIAPGGGPVDLLSNRLVLIAHGASAAPLSSLRGLPQRLHPDDYIAMALVDAVPAGQYGKAALETLGLWETLSPHIVQSDNVRSALALVVRGEAAYGIVYASDARDQPNISVIAHIAPQTHPPIRYPAALIRGYDTPDSRAFFSALQNGARNGFFERYGFSAVESANE